MLTYDGYRLTLRCSRRVERFGYCQLACLKGSWPSIVVSGTPQPNSAPRILGSWTNAAQAAFVLTSRDGIWLGLTADVEAPPAVR